ncbi:uncharacterized protein LOC132193636 isoform X2 [Neocloeon triangulifer]|nr:uncharacterized protein LOC132193636 isoform X2 [Neocloeon triangulifer]
MVSVSVEGGPAAGGLPAAADDVETEDEERRLCSMPHVSSVQIVPCGGGGSGGGEARTFTSTEAQTEPDNREQRRRERRERRQQRLLRNSAPAAAPAPTLAAPGGATTVEIPAERLLPDLLMNSYQQPPPYSTLPIRTIAGPPPPLLVPTTALATATPGSPPALVHQPLAMRFSFPISPTSRRCRGGSGRASHLSEEPKSCCGLALTQAASIRWFIVLIAFVGVCCAVVGTVLGAMRASGREHLTISLLMIGVGIVLVLVSGVGWRLTAHDAPSCRAMLGLGGHSARAAGLSDGDGAEPNRRFVPRLPPSYGRPHHPYAAMIYPEFQYRPPPPSYQASMQEYRLRLLLLDRGVSQPPPPTTSPMAAVSPPPTYRSNVGSMLRAPMIFRRDNNQSGLTGDASVCSSRPPSYRSRAGSTRPASVAAGVESNPAVGLTPTPSPTPPSPQPPSVSVICVGSPKILAPGAAPIEVDSEKASLHEEQGHLVTIVQTGHHEISSDPGVTTVTVSGLLASTSTDCGPRHLVFTPTSNEGEMEILAHL